MQQTLLILAAIVFFNVLTLLPLLIFSSLRRLIRRFPGEKLFVNYLVATLLYASVHLAALLSAVMVAGGLQGVEALQGPGVITVGQAFLVYILVAGLTPRFGGWEPKQEDELDGRVALGLVFVWYSIGTVFSLFLFMIIAISLFFPG